MILDVGAAPCLEDITGSVVGRSGPLPQAVVNPVAGHRGIRTERSVPGRAAELAGSHSRHWLRDGLKPEL
jgi:hypothetical protein